MKLSISLIFFFLLLSCSNEKKVYWCGDHACINKKEREAYFKKTMIVEVRKLNVQDKKNKSELEVIKKQNNLKNKNKIKGEKELAKQTRLDEKTRLKEEKELAKQTRLDEKTRLKEEKELAKQVRLEEKNIIINKNKPLKKKVVKTQNVSLEKEIVIDADFPTINISSTKFKEMVEKITKKNMTKSYPDINKIPN